MHVAWLLRRSIDASVDPCENFYEYVCSGYGGIVNGSLLDEMHENVSSTIYRHFLDTLRYNTSATPKPTAKAAAFYTSCVRRVHWDGNTSALASFFRKYNFSFHAHIIDFHKTTLELLLRFGIDLFFTLDVDARPPFREVPQRLRLGFSRSFEEWKMARTRIARKGAFVLLARRVISATGFRRNATSKLISEIWYVESMILNLTNDFDRTVDVKKIRQNWLKLLKFYSNEALPGRLQLDLESEPAVFFHQMMLKADNLELSLYITWELARHLSSVSGLIKGERRSNWRAYCYNLSYSFFGPAIIAPALLPIVNASRLTQVQRMVKAVVREVAVSIRDSDWLAQETKTQILKKLAFIRWKLAAEIGNWSRVEANYDAYPLSNGVFLLDYIKTSQAYMRHMYRMVVEQGALELPFRSRELGVSYEFQDGLIVTTMSMLPPLFSYGGLPETNYGLLGSVFVRTLMRAFGHNNMLRDGQGFAITWSPEEQSIFEDRYHCDLLSEVSNFGSDRDAGVSVGAQALFRAYRKASDVGRERVLLQGLETLSADRLFFASRCLLHCGDPTDASRPEEHACNLMAKHSAEFAAAFLCPVNRTTVFCDMW
ncbi:kell blood group glycoprotein homolog [Haemaphysalis longicornis]